MNSFQLLFVVLFISIPEIMLILDLGLCLIGEKLNIKKLFLLGLVYGGICYPVMLWVPFGIHSIILLVTCIILLKYIAKKDFKEALLIVLLGFVMCFGVEFLLTLLFKTCTGLSMLQVKDVFFLRLLHFLPKALILWTMIYLCRKYKFSVLNNVNISS